MAGPDRSKPASGIRADLGVAYGLIAGAALGSLLMVLTGDVLWVSIGPGAGLLAGLAVAGLVARRGDPDREQDDDA